MSRGMITSIDTVTQVSIKFREKKKVNKNMDISVRLTQTIYMKMAINVYKYGREGKCVCMFRNTYAGITRINMQIEKEDRHMGRVIHIPRAPYHRYVSNSQ